MKPKTEIIKKPIKIYSKINNIFFSDYQQRYIKIRKITDFEKEELEKEIINEKKEGKLYVLKDYYLNFIEENVLRLFKDKNINRDERENIKYNIETILRIFGEEKTKYYKYYYPHAKNRPVVDKTKSIEALKKFRKEFGITEKEYKDDGIIKRLEENGLDIYKTFEKIFGV